MTEKGKEQKALKIYQQLMYALAGITDEEGINEIVNTLIDENRLHCGRFLRGVKDN